MPIKMKAASKESEINEEWKGQMEYFTKKCKFTKEEEKEIIKICKKVNLSPQRVIETIGVNSPYGKLREEEIGNLEIAISHTKARIANAEKRLNEIKGESGKESGILGKIKDMFSEKRMYENELEVEKRRLKRYGQIKAILEEIKGKDEIIRKIKKNTNYKSKEEMNF
ncbi:MAG: hypothetical protein N3G74_00820 [Candidatus Micrarchaeota archaeon]|nr:hypothetical protein [Candidatus Micrarchaeota archaeon]